MCIAQTSTPTSRNHYPLTLIQQVRNYLAGLSIANNSTAGNEQDNIFTLLAVHFLSRTSTSRFSGKTVAIAIINKRVDIMGGFKIDTPTPATIASIWPTKRGKLLASEMERPITTIARFNINLGMIV